MGHATFEELLDQLVAVRDTEFRSDPARDVARLDGIESILLALLEKLRDRDMR